MLAIIHQFLEYVNLFYNAPLKIIMLTNRHYLLSQQHLQLARERLRIQHMSVQVNDSAVTVKPRSLLVNGGVTVLYLINTCATSVE